jgi:hypothetical protein
MRHWFSGRKVSWAMPKTDPARLARLRERYATEPEFRQQAIDKAARQREQKPEYFRAYFRSIRPRMTRHERLRKYALLGFSEEQYEAMLEAQGGVCAICRLPDSAIAKTVLCVDHDHRTGDVRGLLCNRCNTAIGLLRDDASIILAAMEYVRRSDTTPVLTSCSGTT